MTLADWTFAKREEARRMHLSEYRAWIEAGAKPEPIYHSTGTAGGQQLPAGKL